MEEWQALLPNLESFPKALQQSLALQALLLVMESVFGQMPDLEKFSLVFGDNPRRVWVRDVQHAENDPQYGTPAHLVRTLDTALAPLTGFIPLIQSCLGVFSFSLKAPFTRTYMVDRSLDALFGETVETFLGMTREEVVAIRMARQMDHNLEVAESGSVLTPRARL